jgi:uncharacterized coiled-coil protein SlyX
MESKSSTASVQDKKAPSSSKKSRTNDLREQLEKLLMENTHLTEKLASMAKKENSSSSVAAESSVSDNNQPHEISLTSMNAKACELFRKSKQLDERIAVLRGSVQKMRERTFPSFSQERPPF